MFVILFPRQWVFLEQSYDYNSLHTDNGISLLRQLQDSAGWGDEEKGL